MNTSTRGLKTLGTGSFSVAFLQKTGRVLLKTADIPKKAMSDGLFPKHRLFPEVNHVGEEGTKELYDMPCYSQPESYKRNLTPRQYRLYNALKKISWSCHPTNSSRMYEALMSLPGEFYREKHAIIEAWEFIRQYSKSDEVGFEICKPNLGIKGRKLILLDAFYTWDSPKRDD